MWRIFSKFLAKHRRDNEKKKVFGEDEAYSEASLTDKKRLFNKGNRGHAVEFDLCSLIWSILMFIRKSFVRRTAHSPALKVCIV